MKVQVKSKKYSFYNSIDIHINDKQIIVYPDIDASTSFNGYQYKDIENHLTKIVEDDLEYFHDMNYGIVFIWNFDGEKMLDFWKFNTNYVDDRSGPLANVRIYKNFERADELEVASGNTLLVLGIEEKLRRKSKDLPSYLKGPAPKLPSGLQIQKNFFA